jgi:CheY-like chemotaxis protein
MSATRSSGLEPEGAPVIVVVEDDGDSLEMMGELLEGAGLRAIGFSNGDAALAYLRSHPCVKAIILDMLMPKMDGWQFRRAQEKDPALAAIPVIVVSGLRVARKNALEWGASAFVVKPFSPDELLGAVASAISG